LKVLYCMGANSFARLDQASRSGQKESDQQNVLSSHGRVTEVIYCSTASPAFLGITTKIDFDRDTTPRYGQARVRGGG
jgi:hypothetical protein